MSFNVVSTFSLCKFPLNPFLEVGGYNKRQIQIKDMIAVRFYLTVVLRKYIFKNIEIINNFFGHIDYECYSFT